MEISPNDPLIQLAFWPGLLSLVGGTMYVGYGFISIFFNVTLTDLWKLFAVEP